MPQTADMPHSTSPKDQHQDVSMDAQPTTQTTTDGDVAMDEPNLTQDSKDEEAKPDVKLEDLFADIDQDDEFGSSMPQPVKQQGSSPPASASQQAPVGMSAADPEVMRSFYQRLFPWRFLFQWLNHGPQPATDFTNREFAFTLEDDSYRRYLSYNTSDLLRKEVLQLMPTRFEIGPVYSTNPRDRKTLINRGTFKPIAKELCFDIDLTDYDGVRTCCDKANICHKCWRFMTLAIQVVDTALREDFGFKHIMWVFSGRRGIHAWVCDKKARTLDDQKRRAVVGYLEMVKGGAQSGKKVNVRRPLHPHISRSLDILKEHFQQDILEAQDPWSTDEGAEKLLQLLPDRTLNDSLRRKWSAAPGRSSASKWADIDALAKTGASKSLDPKALLEAKQDVVLEYMYPRLDVMVSKQTHHLLKSPFVVHPKTGNVCVPIDIKNLDDFDPLNVPTVQNLLEEINAWQDDDEGGKKVADWEKTGLKPYIDQFRQFVAGIIKEEGNAKVKRERDEDAMDF